MSRRKFTIYHPISPTQSIIKDNLPLEWISSNNDWGSFVRLSWYPIVDRFHTHTAQREILNPIPKLTNDYLSTRSRQPQTRDIMIRARLGIPSLTSRSVYTRPWAHQYHRRIHTQRPLRSHHFDTHQFVQRLEAEGLSRSQSEGLMAAIAEVIDESVRNMSRNMVTKTDQEKYSYTQKVDFAQLKSEIQLLEKNDVALMKADNDRLVTDVERLKARLREEISRTQASVRLDLNLEKGGFPMLVRNERLIGRTGRIRDESSVQELKIREVDTRIESEIAGLRTAIEQSKQSTLQYLVTVATGCAALLMAYMRFRM
ncbi:unnamed protein product [Rhizoctonia solani]|uniref:Protein FMP32, mitochondrial n=1 Tax=Rhizoctonia solani TaxID=456999 RepID=A0A8H3ABR0_9AGAM|nr:unnamed protein product [Rhizoctonia solani]